MLKIILLAVLIFIIIWRYKYKNFSKIKKRIETVLYAYVFAIILSSLIRIIY